MKSRLGIITVVVVAIAATAFAGDLVPFRGTWSGATISADLSQFPIVFVVASGTGQLTHLGNFTMVSPHYNNVFDFTLWGQQIFTAADGSVVYATFSGQLTPNADGSLSGTIPCVITGGTGRFDGATGTYDFAIVARPLPNGAGFASTATFDGVISTVGSE